MMKRSLGRVSITLAVAQVGVLAGQRVDLILTAEGGVSGLFLWDVPVLAVQQDGRLTLSMDEQDLIRLNRALGRGVTVQAVVAGKRFCPGHQHQPLAHEGLIPRGPSGQ